ncbi:Fic family protein [Amycolatopsis alkalitolerans]|uniref:Oxidoreductase n=1 Tax=Amycolatopsis alkalitolerans TaxID=2547244 RepID=A0A5C4LSR8_9PSEU|nr:oxidoreductase [Amycolatopsis alkalitolerans]TNC21054.1 oxidoreductase [Amycolatopsis alkalitolerans]
MSDPLAPLLELDGVAAAVKSAQDAVFAVHRHPANLRGGSATAAEASVRAARASAAIDGADPEIPADAAVKDPLLAGALRVAESLESLLPTWRRAPAQALARMHVLAAADLVSDADTLGRPRAGTGERLELLAQLVTGATSVPGPLQAAVVHGELLALGPFGTADGVVARAAARLTMVATGTDPKSLTVPEVACLRRVARYREAAQAFATGEPDGVRAWLLFCCDAMEMGAREARGIAEAAS